MQEIARQRLLENEKNDALNAAFDLLNARLPSPDWDEKGWQLWEQLAPHCRALLDHLSGHVLEPEAVRIMNQYGLWLQNRGQYTNAEPIFQRALAISTKALSKEHPDTLTSMNNLASLYYTQNQYAKAESLHRQVLRILAEFGHRKGHEHPHFRTAINNYAGLLSSMGLSEAEILARLRAAIESEPDESA